MSTKQRFYPWLVTVATGLIMASIVDAYSGVIGVFLTPISQSMGAKLSTVSIFYTVLVLVLAVTVPFVGKIIEKVNLSLELLITVVVTAISAYIISNAKNLFIFFLMAAILGICMATGGLVVQGIVINNWFEKKRNLAFSISSMIESIFLVIMTPITSLLIQNFGWKLAFLTLAILTLVLGIPSALVIRLKPEELQLLPYGARSEAEAEASRELDQQEDDSSTGVKTRAVILSAAFVVSVLFTILVQFPGNIVQLFPTYGTTTGIGATNGALMVSVASFAALIVVPLIGSTSDRMGTAKALPLWCTIGIIGFIVLIAATFTTSVPLSLLGAGLATAAYSLFGSGQEILARYMLGPAFNQGFPYVTSISYFAGAFIMPILSGLYEGSKSFVVVYGFCALATVLTIILILFGKKHRIKSEGEN